MLEDIQELFRNLQFKEAIKVMFLCETKGGIMNHHLVFGKNFSQRKKLWEAYKLGKWTSWDLGSKAGDIYCAMSVGYNKRGQLIIKGITYQEFYKGGEKVNLRERPYLDVEVVEVKVKKYIPKVCRNCPSIEGCTDIEDRRREELRHRKGTWVNGENIDKIEFPCACTYDLYGERRCGILTSGIPEMEFEYILHSINPQNMVSVEVRKASLEKLIEQYDIHIEKAKIVIFKEIH